MTSTSDIRAAGSKRTYALRLAVPVYMKKNNIYELQHCVSHDVLVPTKASAKEIVALAKTSIKSAPAIVRCAGDSVWVAGVTHETRNFKNFDMSVLGPNFPSFVVSEYLDVIVNNQSSVVSTSQFGLTVCPVFGKTTGFARTVAACLIDKYTQEVVRRQLETLQCLIRKIVVVELHVETCEPSTIRPQKRPKIEE